MFTSDFSYHLPPELIAQRPVRPRDSSRLLVFDRQSGEATHQIFRQLPSFLSEKDVLVLNETKVLPARLRGTKIHTGGAVEVLLLHRVKDRVWEVIVGGRGLKPGVQIQVDDGPEAVILEDLGGSGRLLEFNDPISDKLSHLGEMPTPPYIRSPIENADEYQTIFAHVPGSAAAPTAGLHFTDRLINHVRELGTKIAKVTLHIGLDTFAPVTEKSPVDHQIHREWCQVDEEAAHCINEARSSGGRVVAVGTTSVRTLETAAQGASGTSTVDPYKGHTSLFILPGYAFQAVDAIITNFHLPQSTLIMMISAFTGRETLLKIYEEAIKLKYRFYSFGDAMLIL